MKSCVSCFKIAEKYFFTGRKNSSNPNFSEKNLTQSLVGANFFQTSEGFTSEPPPIRKNFQILKGGGTLSSVISVVPLERFLTFSENLKKNGGTEGSLVKSFA